ncbi:hypothetical protein CYMTET_44463 [Cymbomonas tetramitiformis]|uniref:Uncharacterized protein n=1 Tax=Cymbomonas tetramitiformis TaxID=36881 RepID=A0AAE0C043_9CHLO|nr:hypothetical protein CYMTET_44463 [Cymbomonas tetramitiformis]
MSASFLLQPLALLRMRRRPSSKKFSPKPHRAPSHTTASQQEVKVLTAVRVSPDVCRVFGQGAGGPQKFGRGLALDEFFVAPRDCAESICYFPEGSNETWGEQVTQPLHGLQLHLEPLFQAPPGSEALPPMRHVRNPSNVPEAAIPQARVRVVAGRCGEVAAAPPLTGVTMLDVEIGAASDVTLPVNGDDGLLIYVLEGVGLFDMPNSEETTYQNEGHIVWFLPGDADSTSDGERVLRIRTHPSSSIRFVVLEE